MTSQNILSISDANFQTEVLKSSRLVLVCFSASWCGPCKQLAPVLDKIADENVGKYTVAKVDIDACPGIASTYHIKGVPTIMVFRDGSVKKQRIGVTDQETLIKMLGEVAGMPGKSSTEAYRDGWDRVFGGKPEEHEALKDDLR